MPRLTLEGTLSAPTLLLIETTVEAVAALFSDTVQVLEELLPIVEGEQDIDESCAGATRLKVTVGPPDPAVMVALWLELTCTAVAVKPAEVCPEVTVTLDGTPKLPLLLESATGNPPEGAAELIVTVQGVVPGVLIVRFVQLTELIVGVATGTVMVPATPVAGTDEPPEVEATTEFT